MKLFILVLCAFLIWTDAVHINSRTIRGRIIGGDTANTTQFPYAAAIYKQTTTGRFFGTGTLISNQWIVTAGQNVQGATLFEIRLGSTSLSSNNPSVLRLATNIYFLHPDFNGFENDVGLIKLRLPIAFTEDIRPISLVPTTAVPSGASLVTFGWGQISDSVTGTVDGLNYVYLVTLSNEECRLVFGNVITDILICAEGNFNEGICRGDLGSPLVQQGGGSLTYLVAVGSAISSNGCESTDPSVFTRLSPYVDWINHVTLNN